MNEKALQKAEAALADTEREHAETCQGCIAHTALVAEKERNEGA